MANGKYQKTMNNILILQTLRNQHLSRRELSTVLGLQPSTVTYAITRLSEMGLIAEIGEDSNQEMGRKRTLLGLKGDYGCVFGIELLVDHFSATVVDITGNSIFECSEDYDEKSITAPYGDVKRFEQIVDYVLNYLKSYSRKLKILGACIGIAGIVDSTGHKIVSSWTQGLTDYDGNNLIKKFPYPVFFENDANCAAVNHMKDENDTFLYTLVQQYPLDDVPKDVPPIGIGMGVVIDGRLRRGYNFMAGEFKSFMYHGDTFDKQLALSNDELACLEDNEQVLRQFLIELFGNLFFVESLIDPRTIYLGGIISKWKESAQQVLDTEFKNEKYLSQEHTFTFVDKSKHDVKNGASLLVLNYLFNLPALDDRSIGWDSDVSPLG